MTAVLASDVQFLVDRYVNDPVAFVREILGAEPDAWQTEVLTSIVDNQRSAVASGHGIGKTALTSFIILWFMATRPYPQCVITANTKEQLTSKTWRELAKWNKRSKVGHWFTWTATKFYLTDAPDTWFASAIPQSENNSEAFAGTHEDHVLMLFDEASAIPDVIWEVAEGAMTTNGARWGAFGNPTRNTGRFRECFGRFKHRWHTMQIDSRSAKMTDKAQIESWIEDYGIDSDFVKVRVLGEFPSAGDMQFIPGQVAMDAQTREVASQHGALVMGVDVARYGDDRSVIQFRRGRDARSMPTFVYRSLDIMALASRVVEKIEEYGPTTVFVDGVGVGGGLVDRLSQLGYGRMTYEVNAGSAPDDKERFKNKRAEMWGNMKDWLKEGAIPNERAWYEDLCGLEYSYDMNQRLQLEHKEDMKKRGLASPDLGDALALTFAETVYDDAGPRRITAKRAHARGARMY
jgi:hypothetical protein